MIRLAIACAFAVLGILVVVIYQITERRPHLIEDRKAMEPSKAAPQFDCPYRHDSRCPRVEDEG